MSTMTKVFVVLTAIFSIALSCMFIAAAAQWDNWRQLALAYQAQAGNAVAAQNNAVAGAQAALALKDDALAARTKELADAQSKIQGLTDDLARTRSELAQSSNERLAAEAGRTKLQEILDVSNGRLKELEKQNQTMLAQTIDLQSRNSRLNSRVMELTTNSTVLSDQVRNLQEKLVAAEQGGAPRGAAKPADNAPGIAAVQPKVAGNIRGEITGVDGNIAQINVGESSGVSPGMVFIVYRNGGAYVCDLVIEKVRPREAVGRLTTTGGQQVRAGDQVADGIRS